MELYKKYRPSTLSQIVGNKTIVNVVKNYLESNSIPHAMMITGPSGTGKTTLARIIANELGCTNVKELNCAEVRGIDNIREIMESVTYAPLDGNPVVFILDEAQKITNDAQNAMLKLLEDPPDHAYFFICTTDDNKIIKTIHTRCTKIEMLPLKNDEMKVLLSRTISLEKETVNSDIVDLIIDNASGSSRSALVQLESVLQLPEDQQEETLKAYKEYDAQVIELCRALYGNASWANLVTILEGLKEQDPEGIRRAVLGYLTSTMLRGKGNRVNQAALKMTYFLDPYFNTGRAGLVLSCFNSTNS